MPPRPARMIFPTFDFLLFFLLVLLAGWLLVGQFHARKFFLIAASYFFYGYWDWRFMALLAASTLINYAGALLVDRYRDQARLAGWVLGATVAMNLVILGFFKYYGFFVRELQTILDGLGWGRDLPFLEIILPVGISFFTFQGISYVVDVARRKIPASTSLPDVMLYISFFPQLVAGPIVRASDFMPQLQRRPDPSRVLISMGVLLILWGLFKKSIVATYLAVDLVDGVFRDPGAYGALDLLLAVYAYAVQIYCDFSAYSDIAIGVAALMGYSFPRNFDQPYRAKSFSDFWRRWHISLSSWLRDYLYIPLGGNRKGRVRTYVNLTLTMLLGGLWHGAAWKFIIWGALHGGALAVERMLGGARDAAGQVTGQVTGQVAGQVTGQTSWRKILAILFVFHFVCLCWIFFRAESLSMALTYIEGFADWTTAVRAITPLTLALIVFGLSINFIPRNSLGMVEARFHRLPVLAKGLVCGLVIVAIEALGLGSAAPFIYFQF
jgi:alginate O-acetyltransferase complex protein AlgI